MVKIVDNKGQYKITLPKDLVLAKGWSKKTLLRVIEDENGNVILKELIIPKKK